MQVYLLFCTINLKRRSEIGAYRIPSDVIEHIPLTHPVCNKALKKLDKRAVGLKLVETKKGDK